MVSNFTMTSRVQALVSFTALATLLCSFNVYAMDPPKPEGNFELSTTTPVSQSDIDKDTFERKKRAAKQGDKDSQFNIATMYSAGEGCTSDPVRALKYFKLSADLGNVEAQFRAAKMLHNNQATLPPYSNEGII